MATYNKFYDYVEQLNLAKHNWDGSTHTFNVCLSNTIPVITNTILANITQIGSGNGYTTDGQALGSVTLTETTGTAKVTIADEVFTASGGTMATFQYVTMFNDTQASPVKPLVSWWDYGSAVSLADTETFTVDFDPTNGVWQLS